MKSDEIPYGYFLGLESDGPLYCGHVAPRDRDRLRGEIMASLGWNLGKLWTYDWFLDPEGEFRRLGDVVSASHAKTLKTMADFPVAPPVLDDDGDGDDGDDDGGAGKNGGDAEDDDNDGENNADGKKTKTAAKK